jgi:hypothetical protein
MKSTSAFKVWRLGGLAAFALLACMLLASAAPAAAAPKDAKVIQPAKTAVKPTTKPSAESVPANFDLDYEPVVKDAPASRGWGASRAGQAKQPPRIYVLAPADFIGTTTREQPTLYWYISEPTGRSIEISLTPVDDPQSRGRTLADPVLSSTLKGIENAGVQKLDLSRENGPKLKKGVRYKWVVELVTSETDGARNPFAECMLTRVEEPASVRGGDIAGLQAAAAYAKAGVWYDALANLSDAIADNPQSKPLREARKKLLRSHKLIEDDRGDIREATPEK